MADNLWDVSSRDKADPIHMEKIREFKEENSLSYENKEFDLKAGDWVEYKTGYNDDIPAKGEIFGFEGNKAYLIKSAYWFPLNLESKHFIKKLIKGISRSKYIKDCEKELKRLVAKRQKLSDRYTSGNLTFKMTDKVNAELNWVGMHIAQQEERIAFGKGLLAPEDARQEYRPSGFHTYKGIRFELEKIVFSD